MKLNWTSVWCAPALSITLVFLGGAPVLAAIPSQSSVPSLRRSPVAGAFGPRGALVRDTAEPHGIGKDGCTTLPHSGFTACFTKRGVRFRRGRTPSLTLELSAYGRDGKVSPVARVRPDIHRNRAIYPHGTLIEWWRVLPTGFEQTFTLKRRPSGKGALILELIASTPAERSKGTLGWGPIHYGKLRVTDARGKEIPAQLGFSNQHVRISVDDENATYPILIDPLVWIQLGKVTASDGAASDAFGQTIAISRDILLVGAPNATVAGNVGQGAAYIFTQETNGTWTQTAELTASDGAAGDHFGASVALLGDTAAVGAPSKSIGDAPSEGAVYLFKSTNDTWQLEKTLTPPSDESESTHHMFGSSVALSQQQLVIAAPYDPSYNNYYEGDIYIYSLTGTSWPLVATLQSGKLSDGFASSISVSDDAILVGAPTTFTVDPPGTPDGMVYLFTNSSGVWSIANTFPARDDDFGSSVAISGSTALISASPAGRPGSAYIFENSSGTWTQSGTLMASDGVPNDQFGTALAISGSSVLVGAPCATVEGDACQGAVYVFTQSNGLWIQTAQITATDGTSNDHFGETFGSSGATLAIGGSGVSVNGKNGQGAAYVDWLGNLSLDSTPQIQLDQGQSFNRAFRILNYSLNSSPILPVSLTSTVPMISIQVNGGSCDTQDGGAAECEFNPVAGDGGSATASLGARADAAPHTTIAITATLPTTHPALTSSTYAVVVGAPPVATNGALATPPNTVLDDELGASDVDGDALTFEVTSEPQHGELALKDSTTGTFSYTPSSDFKGTDSFTFKANDGYADSSVAKVSVLVDSAPAAKDGSLTTSENSPVSEKLSASDADGDALTFDVVSPPRHGTVTLSPTPAGSISYVPAKGFTGSDRFTFKANDGLTDSNVATISITVKSAGSSSTPPPAGPSTNVSSGCGCATTQEAGGSMVLWALLLLAILTRSAPFSRRTPRRAGRGEANHLS